ncbi:MAG: metal-dependent transcriptional regulator [Aigarchaeota archaeon]|nr:metal-dependent transcriptional regulator [Aigarchaeota archaeon]MDW8021355.1 metal-dependent transcriptional regulator [Nitrososphaerota archaeon]
MSDVNDLTTREVEYLLAVFKHSKGKAYARQFEIIRELKVDKSTASLMIKKLAKKGYLTAWRRGVALTEKGRRAVKEILWRHGVLENALVKLGVSFEEACAVTWEISGKIPREIMECIWVKLGKPDVCPCGHSYPFVDHEVELEKFEVCLTYRAHSPFHGL